VDDARELVAAVPIRCGAPGNDRNPHGICGEAASWVRPCVAGVPAYFCDVHRRSGDMPIAVAAIVRRISIVVEVCFNGTAPGRLEAEGEALARLHDAVAAVGGALSLHSVTSDIGRQGIPAPVPATNGRRPRGRDAR